MKQIALRCKEYQHTHTHAIYTWSLSSYLKKWVQVSHSLRYLGGSRYKSCFHGTTKTHVNPTHRTPPGSSSPPSAYRSASTSQPDPGLEAPVPVPVQRPAASTSHANETRRVRRGGEHRRRPGGMGRKGVARAWRRTRSVVSLRSSEVGAPIWMYSTDGISRDLGAVSCCCMFHGTALYRKSHGVRPSTTKRVEYKSTLFVDGVFFPPITCWILPLVPFVPAPLQCDQLVLFGFALHGRWFPHLGPGHRRS